MIDPNLRDRGTDPEVPEVKLEPFESNRILRNLWSFWGWLSSTTTQHFTLNVCKVGWATDIFVLSCDGHHIKSNYSWVTIKSTTLHYNPQTKMASSFFFSPLRREEGLKCTLKCSNQQNVAPSRVTHGEVVFVLGRMTGKLWVVLMRLCSVSFSRGSLPSCFKKTSNHSPGSCPPPPPPRPPHLLNIWTLESHLLFFF